MTNPQDFTKFFTEAMGAFPIDTSAFAGAFKNSAAMGEKMSRVALEAAEKSTEISGKWTKSTISKLGGVAVAKDEPVDYSKAMTDFASASAEMAAENMAAFAEVAKKVQMETIELVLAAGKDMQDETTAAVKTATNEVAKATKKATAK